jgi:V-type H+-transporting ATPase subunit F
MNAQQGKLIAVIGDEDSVIGFLMSGSGELNKTRQPNFFIYDKSKYSFLLLLLFYIFE